VCVCVFTDCLINWSTEGKYTVSAHLEAGAQVSLASPAKGRVEHQVTKEEHVLLWRSAVAGHSGPARRCLGRCDFPAVGRVMGKLSGVQNLVWILLCSDVINLLRKSLLGVERMEELCQAVPFSVPSGN